MAVKAKFEGRERVMARLRRLVPDAEQEAAKAQLEAANELAAAIRSRAPVRSGEYRDSIKGGRLSDAPGGQLVGIQQTKDPNATGIFARFLWRFLEFGTIKDAAQPHIFPTYRAMKKRIRRKVATAVNRAIRKAKG